MTGSGARSLDNRVAIVTGGSRGIGKALCIGLAAAGARVVVSARSAGSCAEVVADIAASGGVAIAVPLDVGTEAGRTELVERAVADFGGIDVLVNNAAVLKPHETIKVREEELDSIIDVNLKAPVFLSACAFPYLKRSGRGSIINISALGAHHPIAGIGAYCAVKAALENWTTTMAMEWTRQGVRVNSLVPGPVGTDMILPRDENARERFVEKMASETLRGRIAEPKELVGAAVFLASDDSALMTGRSLFMDGGMFA
ncbi:4-formylbenzenesulfonate dehydrogenase TsaC1/TsaC2 [Rhodococcus sp. Br-6]|nr:4-formylbenzenesulfonate dehydrogenase TsaC1/TsaC2 [Rhodococcus sp. Br-6]